MRVHIALPPQRMRRLLLSVLGALAISAAFQTPGWWWSAPLGFAMLVASSHGAALRCAAALGAVAGTVFAGATLFWLTSVGLDAYLAVTAVFSVFWASMFAAMRLAMVVRAWPILVPAVWVAQEWLVSRWPLGGFPWVRLAYVSVDSPVAPLVPYVGGYATSYVMAALGSLLAAVLIEVSGRRLLLVVGLTTAIVAMTTAASNAADLTSAPVPIRVAVIQGGSQPGAGPQQARAVLAAHVRQTLRLPLENATPLTFVLWPESATDIDPFRDRQARAQITSAVDSIGVPVVVGAVTGDPEQAQLARNQAILWSPLIGPGAVYTKRQLVPFGEYVPARSLLERFTTRFAQVPRDFASGTDPPVMAVAEVPVGLLICYEVAFDDRVVDAVDSGATVLAVPANNATYAGTTQPGQQLLIARFRALESARPTLVASTTGVSAIIDETGAVLVSIEDGQAGSRIATVTPSSRITTAIRWGDDIGLMIALVAVLGLIAGAGMYMRSTQRPVRTALMTSTRSRVQALAAKLSESSPVPCQEVGRIRAVSKVGIVGSARPMWTS